MRNGTCTFHVGRHGARSDENQRIY
jgi:hypothetical protein